MPSFHLNLWCCRLEEEEGWFSATPLQVPLPQPALIPQDSLPVCYLVAFLSNIHPRLPLSISLCHAFACRAGALTPAVSALLFCAACLITSAARLNVTRRLDRLLAVHHLHLLVNLSRAGLPPTDATTFLPAPSFAAARAHYFSHLPRSATRACRHNPVRTQNINLDMVRDRRFACVNTLPALSLALLYGIFSLYSLHSGFTPLPVSHDLLLSVCRYHSTISPYLHFNSTSCA